MRKKKVSNLQKFEIRGTIKEIMKNRNLRAISVSNYQKWKSNGDETDDSLWLHSIKINLENGYITMHKYNPNSNKAGEVIEHPDDNMYRFAYDQVIEILANENDIPTSKKRNILVKMSR